MNGNINLNCIACKKNSMHYNLQNNKKFQLCDFLLHNQSCQWNSHFSHGMPVTKFQSHLQKIFNGSTVSFENIT